MKVLIATSSFAKFSEKPINLLVKNDFEIVSNSLRRKMKTSEIIKVAKDVDAIIAGTEEYDSHLLENLQKLKIISRVGVGIDNVDLTETTRRHIQVSKSSSSPSLAVAEFTLSLILNLLKKINSNSINAKKGVWLKEAGTLISSKTIGIVGTGQIGSKLIEILSGFNVNFLVFDKYRNENLLKNNKLKYVSLEELFNQSDIVTIHLPHTKETNNLINKSLFCLLKDNSIFINTSRGSIVEEQDLLEFLTENPTVFAALDVFKEEPYSGPLQELDNVLITPHIAAYAKETRIEMEIEAVEHVVNFKKKNENR